MTRSGGSSDEWEELPKLLSLLSSGSISVRIDGNPLVSVDVDHKDIDVQVGPLRDHQGDMMSVVSHGGTSLLGSLRVPGELAREEWRISIKDGATPIAEVGRGTSVVTNHVRLHAGAIDELRKVATVDELRKQVRRLI